MKKKPIILALCAALFLLAAACHRMYQGSPAAPPPDGKAFWNYITKEDNYKNWAMWPGAEGIYPGKSPHGAYLKLYVNYLGLKAAKEVNPTVNGKETT